MAGMRMECLWSSWLGQPPRAPTHRFPHLASEDVATAVALDAPMLARERPFSPALYRGEASLRTAYLRERAHVGTP